MECSVNDGKDREDPAILLDLSSSIIFPMKMSHNFKDTNDVCDIRWHMHNN